MPLLDVTPKGLPEIPQTGLKNGLNQTGSYNTARRIRLNCELTTRQNKHYREATHMDKRTHTQENAQPQPQPEGVGLGQRPQPPHHRGEGT